MNTTSTQHDPFKELMKDHKLQQPSHDFTHKVMGKIQMQEVADTGKSPAIQPVYWVSALILLSAFMLSVVFFDIPLMESFQNIFDTQGAAFAIKQLKIVSESIMVLLSSLFGNNLFIIVASALGLLIGLDHLLRGRSRQAWVFL
ncbi:MAG: hypothetical protein K9H84_01950 [Bacteroidales bacterium]|nr:hypothetical protein [Bacteroidales bacterium]